MPKPRFANMDRVQMEKTAEHFKRWGRERILRARAKDYSFTVPNVMPDTAFIYHNRTEPSVTWIGHSTFLIQLAGVNIVTDPVWAGQMGLHRRLVQPGLPIEEMPPIDLILISHSHYDHLHIASLHRLGGPKTILVPAGLARKLRMRGFGRVHELHWWESFHYKGLKMSFVPSQHWTRRNPWDMNSSHWGGWVIEPGHGLAAHTPEHPDEGAFLSASPSAESRSAGEDALARSQTAAGTAAAAERVPAGPGPAPGTAAAAKRVPAAAHGKQAAPGTASASRLRGLSELFSPGQRRPKVGPYPTVYFAGDSGYFRGFRDIGARYDIDIALMPIGAYEPESFMGAQHVTPEEALQAFEDIGGGWFVPMHYGTFKLADDTPREALERLESGRVRQGIGSDRLVVLPLGETWRLSGK